MKFNEAKWRQGIPDWRGKYNPIEFVICVIIFAVLAPFYWLSCWEIEIA